MIIHLILLEDIWDTTNAFNGYIDEIGIWNRTLNDTEISWLYNSGDGLSYSSFSEEEVLMVL